MKFIHFLLASKFSSYHNELLIYCKTRDVKSTCIGSATPTKVLISSTILGFPSHCISNSIIISPGSPSIMETPERPKGDVEVKLFQTDIADEFLAHNWM